MVLMVVAMLPQNVIPSPTPSSTIAPLREIGRIHVTTPLCKSLVGDAVRAINIEAENNGRLTLAEHTLETVDLDSNQLVKHNAVANITRQYVTLRAAAVEGNGLMRDFLKNTKTVASEEQRANLTSFAEALDGALHRQKVLSDDLGRLIAYLDAHEPIDKDTHDSMIFHAIVEQNDRRFFHSIFDQRNYFGPAANVPDQLSTTARNAAEEIRTRAEPVETDEIAAATRIDPAFAGC